MCDFISWIEYGERILYLEDRVIFSSEGRKRLKGCMHNDFIGHGAIGKFFNLKNSQGEEKEEIFFWHPKAQKRIPKEIVDKLKTPELFLRHWGKSFEEFFTKDDLLRILFNAPEEWGKIAAKEILRRKGKKFSSVEDAFVEIAKTDEDGYIRKAIVEMLDPEKNNDTLVEIAKTDKDSSVRLAAVGVLDVEKNREAFVEIAKTDDNPHVRSLAAFRLYI
ncbi:MAG: hypothetical protein GF387_01730 [Candidatus Portnoybacteria bacterium]|nr:hypothetical protein [Candidatus Portnoybacteria bacterium]